MLGNEVLLYLDVEMIILELKVCIVKILEFVNSIDFVVFVGSEDC